MQPGEAVIPLGMEHRDAIERHIAALRYEPSDWSFANLWLFRGVHRHRWVPDERLPRIEGVSYDGKRYIMPLFPLATVDEQTLGAMLGDRDFFFPLGQRDVSALSTEAFCLSHREDDSDYVYARASMASLSGRELRERRRQAELFARKQMPRIRRLDVGSVPLAREVAEAWLVETRRAREATDIDICHEALDHQDTLGLKGLLVETGGGEPAGFVLWELLATDQACVRFAKGRRMLPGVYPYLFRAVARSLPTNIAWINFEQDLGNPGFRRAKEAYAPAHRIRKFRVQLKRQVDASGC